MLTDWRNRFIRSFLTEFTATAERTARWLTEIVGPTPSQILFMVDDADGRTFGYMGLACIDWERGTFEVDAIVRGAEAPRGLMSEALRTLIVWAQGQLQLGEARVRVLSDNTALTFYQKLGFREIRRVSLRRVEEPGMVRWVEDEGAADASRSLIYLGWSGSGDV
jgi:RimJ/RimL family protein N-acetyltransferase